jgi:hypothetical protein
MGVELAALAYRILLRAVVDKSSILSNFWDSACKIRRLLLVHRKSLLNRQERGGFWAFIFAFAAVE